MMLVGEAARPLAEWRPLLFGGILIAFLTLLPGGLDSLMSKVRELLDRRTADGTKEN